MRVSAWQAWHSANISQGIVPNDLFFGSAAVAPFYLARIIKHSFAINRIIEERPDHSDEILESLKNCLPYWQKIKHENLVVVKDSKRNS